MRGDETLGRDVSFKSLLQVRYDDKIMRDRQVMLFIYYIYSDNTS